MKKVFVFCLLFLVGKLNGQNYDWSRSLASVGCCSVQATGITLFYVSKSGNLYSIGWASGGLSFIPDGDFSCVKKDKSQWGVFLGNINNKSFNTAQVDGNDNVILGGWAFGSGTFYFDSTHNVSYSNGNFYVKYNAAGIALWVSNRLGDYPVVDPVGGFVSVSKDSTYKYDSNGTIVWSKIGGAKNNACPSYDNNFYYLLDSTVLSKCDTAGNSIWTNNSYTGSKLIADSMEFIYIRSGNTINKLDSSGNFIFSRFYSGLKDFAVDKAGNIYILTEHNMVKYDTTGTVSLLSANPGYTHNLKLGVGSDMIYFGTNYQTYDTYIGQTNPLYFPPNFYHPGENSVPPVTIYALATRINQSDTIPGPDSIFTANVNAACKGATFLVSYTINSYPVTPSPLYLYKVQLSDSSGSFANPVQIGQGNYSPITCTIPTGVTGGTNYRIRVILQSIGIIGTESLPFAIYNIPVASFIVSNYGSYLNGTYYGCTGTSITLTAPFDTTFSYQWFSYVNGNPPIYTALQYGPSNIFNCPGSDAYLLKVFNNAGGCVSSYSPIVNVIYNTAPVVSFTGLPDTLCTYSSPQLITLLPQGGVLTGNGISANYFYPDSAQSGNNLITYAYIDNNGCTDSATQIVYVDACLGINSPPKSLKYIYPNPVSDNLYFINTGKSSPNAIILGLTGKEVLNCEACNTPIFISSLNPGMYVIKLQWQNEIVVTRFIKK